MRHISRLRSFAWYATAGMLVLLAMLVTAARLLMGEASDYRGRMEELAGQYLGQPVSISNMDARLVGIKPTLLFKDVSLREESGSEQLAHFNQIGIALNPLSSLRHLQPIIDLTIHGANLVVIQQKDGGFRLQGGALSEKAKSGKGGGDLGAWFLSQSRLELKNSRILWRNTMTGRDTVFNNVSVELRNMSKRHRLNASVQLPEEIGKTLRLALDVRGNVLNEKDWVGELYLKAEQVKPSQWVEDFDYEGLRFSQGNVDLELWSGWRNGLLETVEGQFDLSRLQISKNSKKLPVTNLSGQLHYRTGDEGWQLLLQKAVIRNVNEQTLPFDLQIEQLAGISSIRAENLNADLLMDFGPYIPGLSTAQGRQMQVMSPGGLFEALRVDMREGELLGAVAQVRDFQVEPWKEFPGVRGLNARFGYDGSKGSVTLDSDKLVLNMPKLFDQPLQLQRTRGLIRAGRMGKGWRVVAEEISVENSDLTMQLGMSLQLQPGKSPLLALVGNFKDGRAAATPAYLPVKIMSRNSVDWLNRAFLGGRVTRGSVLVHGRLDRSLMREEQGRFEVRFDANDVTLDYQEGWPKLTAVRGDALFTGRGMEINAADGRFYSSRVNNTKVEIPEFDKPVLKVEGSVQASAADALHFLREAPFSSDLGLQAFSGYGDTPVRLSLTIPLSDETRAVSPLSVDGDVTLQGNYLHFAKGVDLHNVRGKLHFTEKSFTADDISAKMYGFPAKVNVYSERSGSSGRGATIVTVRGHANAASVRKALGLELLEVADGESDWQARMTLSPGDKGGGELVIYSDLKGVALNLPEPMGKKSDEERALVISLGLAGKEQGIHSLKYNGRFNTTWQLENDSGKLRRMGILLGQNEAAQLPEKDLLRIGGVLDNFNWLEWRKVINQYFPHQAEGEQLPLQIHMQRLHLVHTEGEYEASDLLSQMPPISIDIHSLAYGDMQIGGIAGRVRPSATRIAFKGFMINAGNFRLSGKGHWRLGGKTRFHLTLNSSNVGKMFSDLGFASVLQGGKAKTRADVEWVGSPLDFSLAKIAAKGQIYIEDGVIAQIKPGSSRMLGLLSLEALPRRLFLDFSDMSKEGLPFTTIKGDIRIRKGDAVTDNLVVKSAPADILVTGRTGLVKRDFEQLVSVVPNVAGTVSVAGALAWGPEVAAMLALFQSIFKSGIDEATMVRYEIGGTWEKPEITRLEPVKVSEASTGG